MAETAEVLLRGLTVAREVVLDGGFLRLERPLPVGTRVVVKVGGVARGAVVKRVVEKGESETTGMEVVWQSAEKSEPKHTAEHQRTTKATKAVEASMDVVKEFRTQRYGEKEIPVPKKEGRKQE